jgi:hypothetical protein
MPRYTVLNPIRILNKMYKPVKKNSPSCIKLIFSWATEENLVWPAPFPVVKNNLSSADSRLAFGDTPYTNPSIKQPIIFTLNVPKGMEEG